MSAIDLIKHARVGYIFDSIPVYLLLEDSSWLNQRGTEQSIDNLGQQHDVCIGGGSGEHPALIIKNVFSAMSDYDSGHEAADDDYATATRIIACSDDGGMTYDAWIHQYAERCGNYAFDPYIIHSIGEIMHFHKGKRDFRWPINGIKMGIDPYEGNGFDLFSVNPAPPP